MSILRLTQLGLIGLLLLALGPSAGQTQFPGGGGGGGGGGGRRGGGRNFDPGMMFDRFANGRTSIPISELPMTQRDPNAFQQWMTQQGITNGELTRDQFIQYMQERRSQRQANRQQGGGPSPDAPPSMPATPAQPNAPPGESNAIPQIPNDPGSLPPMEEEKRLTVYRAGKLPKGLPDWFAKLDTDGDGQIGLYEWKQAGRSLDEFRKLDRNGDGFITVDEVLRSLKNTTANAANHSVSTTPAVGNENRAENNSDGSTTTAAPPADNSNSRSDRSSRRQGGNRRQGNGQRWRDSGNNQNN